MSRYSDLRLISEEVSELTLLMHSYNDVAFFQILADSLVKVAFKSRGIRIGYVPCSMYFVAHFFLISTLTILLASLHAANFGATVRMLQLQ